MAKGFGVDLLARLDGIAAIDKKGRLVGEDDGEAGAAGKTGQPGQPLLAGRDIFVLMGVGAWNEKAVELQSFQPRAQHLEAGGAEGRVGGFVESLETGVEHRPD